MRVLIAVTHLLGAGHLTRAAALARALAAEGHAVVLASGGSPAPLVRTDGVRLLQLDPVHIRGTAFSDLLDSEDRPADGALFARRREALLGALADLAPDAVVTELFPFGRRALAAEFLALVEAARARRPRPLVLASVRDILVAPDRPAKVAEAHARVADLYDGVLVHGDPALAALDASWPVDSRLASRLTYTGYVDEGGPLPETGPRAGILVAAGSSAAGLGLLAAAAEAARRRPDLGWRILAGNGVPEPAFRAMGEGLAPGTLERARPDYRALLARAAVSVSQCGYNTAVDLLAAGPRAVLVPFEAGRETEQRLRAERLAARSLASVLPEAELTADALLAAVEAASSAPEPPAHGIRLDGAARTAALIGEMRRRRAPAGLDLDPLRAALDAAGEAGRRVRFWWRDDDAVAGEPALDRLLDLAEGTPILLAAIPAGIVPSLAERLARAPLARAAVHGLAHANHAPAGEKRAEFGPHRPLDVLCEEAEAALGLARVRLPEVLPVFVPPWNRIAPDLAAALADLGYAGLSAAGGGAGPVALVRHDIDLDPIDWRGTRSLVDPARLVADLVRRVAAGGIGLLTHHRVHDAALWDFLGALLPLLVRHPAVDVADPRDLFSVRPVDGEPAAWSSAGTRIS